MSATDGGTQQAAGGWHRPAAPAHPPRNTPSEPRRRPNLRQARTDLFQIAVIAKPLPRQTNDSTTIGRPLRVNSAALEDAGG